MATPHPALAALALIYLSGEPLPKADPEGLTPKQTAALKSAREVQAGCLESEDDAQYRTRAVLVAEGLELGSRAAEASKAYPACVRRVAGGYSSPALETAVLERLSRSEGVAVERRAAAEKRLRALASQLSTQVSAQTLDGAGAGRDFAPGSGGGGIDGLRDQSPPSAAPGSSQDVQALVRELNAAQATRPGLVKPSSTAVPEPTEFHALASEEVAPAAGVMDRAASLAAKDAPTIAQDLAAISSALRDAELPNVAATNEMNPDAIRQFFAWLRTVTPANMPTIDYAILDKGLVGRYELGALSKGTITLNHFIRDQPAHARASVLVHELYHYWDKKVAKNYYPNVSYGRIGEGTQHIHEYDAYIATAQFWQMVKREGETSPLARLLDRIPVETDAVRALVDGAVRR